MQIQNASTLEDMAHFSDTDKLIDLYCLAHIQLLTNTYSHRRSIIIGKDKIKYTRVNFMVCKAKVDSLHKG